MSEKTVFLVFGFDYYEYPYNPIKAFVTEADAQALLAEITAYQAIKPAYPDDSASDEEFDAWEKAYAEWRSAHPAGDANGHDGFNVMPLQLEDART